MHACLNALPDGWTYELRKPLLSESEASLPFFDVELLLQNNTERTEWWFETRIYFKRLCRTHADSWWSWDHAEALIRSHLDRTARICSSTDLAVEAVRTLGWMLARRQHSFENLVLSLKRLKTVFLAQCSCPVRTLISPQNCQAIGTFRTWEPPADDCNLRMSGTVPFAGPNCNDIVKRITWKSLRKLCDVIHPDLEVTINVNNTPFRSLSRLLPVAKIMPPPLTQSNLVYQIGNEESCGIGQIGQRPLMHRLTEHFFDMRAGNGPYAGTSLNPFFDAKILGFESNRFMRLALEAFEIGTSPACRSMESINLGPWRDLFDRFRMVHNIGGGAIIPADFGPGVPALLPPLLPPSGPRSAAA